MTNPYEAPKSDVPVAPSGKIRALGRWCCAIVSVAILAFIYVSYELTRAINGYYFRDYGLPSLGVPEIVGILLAVYLGLVAIFGQWRLFFRRS
jgi:hypothetical protein